MDICEFANKMGRELIILWHPDIKKFSCEFDYSFLLGRKGSRLVRSRGHGSTVNKAMRNYIQMIRGRFVAFPVCGDNNEDADVRWQAPKNLRMPKGYKG